MEKSRSKTRTAKRRGPTGAVLAGLLVTLTLASYPSSTSATQEKRRVETRRGWEAALAATYVRKDPKTEEDGRTTFMACMGNASVACAHGYFGEKDPFKKALLLTPAATRLNHSDLFVEVHVSVGDCEAPKILVAPKVFSKTGWLFMDKVAVMADDKLVMERQANPVDTDRSNAVHGTSERFVFFANPKELQALRSVAAAKSVMVRLSGSNGYANIQPEDAKAFQASAAEALYAYDKIQAALSSHLPAQCG